MSKPELIILKSKRSDGIRATKMQQKKRSPECTHYPSTPHISNTPPPMVFTRSKPPSTFKTHGSTLFSVSDVWEVLVIGKTIRCFWLMGIDQNLLGSSVWSDQGRVMLVCLVQNIRMLFLSLIIQKIIAFMVV